MHRVGECHTAFHGVERWVGWHPHHGCSLQRAITSHILLAVHKHARTHSLAHSHTHALSHSLVVQMKMRTRRKTMAMRSCRSC